MVTDSSYRNKYLTRIYRSVIFHFTKDEITFSRFALEMLATDPSLIFIKKTEVDVEEASLNGMKHFLPKIEIYIVCDTYKHVMKSK